MSTKEEYEKLIKNTTNKWVENYKGINGLNGSLLTAKNGNTLFFPAAGDYDGAGRYIAGKYGYVWSASHDSNYPYIAFYLYFDSGGVSVLNGGSRCRRFSVRGVKNQPLTERVM